MCEVHVKQGMLRGAVDFTDSGKKFYNFKGIPYAKPPLGDLRFMAPQPPECWSGIRNATEHGGICPQWDMFTNEYFEGDEDCLFLNVYAPRTDGKLLPVMVWFHGGGFTSGSGNSDIYSPHYLVEEDIVLVTVNYRLEVFGFLCLDTKEVPGNAGLKDQVAALRWIQENIMVFGGDPNNVTIFGESAGAASVTYHMMSPMSKGLFHKAIAQSGCFLNEWTLSSNNVSLGKRLGKYLGIETDDIQILTRYLKNVPKENLIRMTLKIINGKEKFRGLPILFCPTIEKEFAGEEQFLTKSPWTLIKEESFAKVPLIFGVNAAEGISIIQNDFKKQKIINNDFTSKIPKYIANVLKEDAAKEIGNKVKLFYLGSEGIREGQNQSICDMESDINFTYGGIKFINIWSTISSNPVFFYYFCFDGALNFMKKSIGIDDVKGAAHADDIFYLFKTPADVDSKSEEWKTIKRMCTMWTNFAKFGNPTPKQDELISTIWKPYKISEQNYLCIDKTLDLKQNLIQDRFRFWDEIYEEIPVLRHIFKCHL